MHIQIVKTYGKDYSVILAGTHVSGLSYGMLAKFYRNNLFILMSFFYSFFYRSNFLFYKHLSILLSQTSKCQGKIQSIHAIQSILMLLFMYCIVMNVMIDRCHF